MLRIVVLTGATAVLVIAGGIAWEVWQARSDAKAAERLVEELSLEDFRRPGVVAMRLDFATKRLETVAERLDHSLWFDVGARLPGIGRQVEAVRAATHDATALARLAVDLAVRIERQVERTKGGTPEVVDLLADLESDFEVAATRLGRIEPTRRTWLLPPVSDLEDDVVSRFADVKARLRDGRHVASAMRSLLTGPGRHLVLAANNAEMRGVGGMALSAGILHVNNGSLDADPFVPTEQLVLEKPVPTPPAMDRLYGWLDPGSEWRNTGSSAHFPRVAPVFAAMAERAGLGAVDGVIHVDVGAVRHLLEAVGPVTFEGIRFDADNVEATVLSELYLRFPDRPEQRRQILGGLIGTTLDALEQSEADGRSLVVALANAARGRHLMLWSADPAIQRAWSIVGADGALDLSGVLVAVQNHGGNKLDWYLDVRVSAERVGLWGRRRILEITLVNDTPVGLPAYVAGSGEGSLDAGDYRAFVTLYLPRDAHNVRLRGTRIVVAGEDPPMRVVGARFNVPRGATRTVVVDFELPIDHPTLTVIPSGRVHPIVYESGGSRMGSEGELRQVASADSQ